MDIFLPMIILDIMDDEDRDFMKELYIQYHLIMYRMAYSLTESVSDAEDVVQDSCESLIRKISLLKTLDRKVLEGYIVSTVKNTSFSLYRKRKGQKEEVAIKEAEDFIDPNPGVEERTIERASLEEMVNAMSNLPERDQVTLRAKYFEQRSDREIAELLGIRESSVRSRLMRARDQLKKELRGE